MGWIARFRNRQFSSISAISSPLPRLGILDPSRVCSSPSRCLTRTGLTGRSIRLIAEPACRPGADENVSLQRSRVRLRDLQLVSNMSMTSATSRALGQVILVFFALGGPAAAQDTQLGRATFAEMIAFARLASVPCQRLARDTDSFHALALRRLIKPPITEEEIAANEKDIKRLRVRLGLSGWCKRYAGQMAQARILVQVLRRQN